MQVSTRPVESPTTPSPIGREIAQRRQTRSEFPAQVHMFRPSSLVPLSSLRGTVQPHNALILLHSAHPPPTFPARGPVSQVSKRLQLAAAQWGGVVNWVYYDPKVAVDVTTDATSASDGESYSATLFSRHGRRRFPRVSVDNVDEVGEAMHRLVAVAARDQELARSNGDDDNVVQLLVCTHTARDCRCGERGGAFVQKLRAELERAGTLDTLRIGQVGHVGGHQFAPNLLIYPYGDWYGLLSPAQIPQILGDIQEAAQSRRGVRPLGKTDEPLLVSHGLKEHWKGRMGMSREEQVVLAERLGLGLPPPVY